MLPAFLLFWGALAGLFVVVMTYRSLRPFDLTGALVAVGFGAAMPLSLMLGFRANRLARACHGPTPGGPATLPAMLLSLFAAMTSCMCCLPILPVLLAFLLAGTVYAAQAGVMASVVATWAPWLYALAAVLTVGSIDRSSRSLVAFAQAAG